MVIVKVLVVIVLSVAEGFVMVNTVLFLCGFAGGINHTESKAHDKWPQLHPVCTTVRLERRLAEDIRGLLLLYED